MGVRSLLTNQKFDQFFEQCPVLKSEEPLRTLRLVLCDLTARNLKLGLGLLGDWGIGEDVIFDIIHHLVFFRRY